MTDMMSDVMTEISFSSKSDWASLDLTSNAAREVCAAHVVLNVCAKRAYQDTCRVRPRVSENVKEQHLALL